MRDSANSPPKLSRSYINFAREGGYDRGSFSATERRVWSIRNIEVRFALGSTEYRFDGAQKFELRAEILLLVYSYTFEGAKAFDIRRRDFDTNH